jgi:hypothetical protein
LGREDENTNLDHCVPGRVFIFSAHPLLRGAASNRLRHAASRSSDQLCVLGALGVERRDLIHILA